MTDHLAPNKDSALGIAKAALEHWNNPTAKALGEQPESLVRVTAELGDALTEIVAAIEDALEPKMEVSRSIRAAQGAYVDGFIRGVAYIAELVGERSVKEAS